jgi:hypothetical protein
VGPLGPGGPALVAGTSTSRSFFFLHFDGFATTRAAPFFFLTQKWIMPSPE